MSGILALQSDVTREVAGALALRLLPAEQARLANARSVNPEAYELCLKGRFHWYKLSREELDALSRIPRTALAALCARIDGRICRIHIAGQPTSEEQRR